MEKHYDVVVIGAGPAGSTAAFYLAKKNSKVLFVDRHDFPRHKACAGALFRSDDWQFENFLKIKNQLPQQQVNEAIFYQDRKYIGSLREPNLFTQIQRSQFDHLLQQQAIEVGAIFRKFSVQHINCNIINNVPQYVLSNGIEEIQTTTIIGADGFSGITSKFLGNPRPKFVRCIEYDILCEKIDTRSHFFFLWGNELGYAWLFPTPNGYYAGLGFMGPTKQTLRMLLDDFITHVIAQGFMPRQHQISKIIGGPNPLSIVPKYAVNNVVLCGDAMGLVSQMSGEGIYFAMRSGMLAAAAYEGNISEKYTNLIKPVIRDVTLFNLMPPPSLGLIISKTILYGMRYVPLMQKLVLQHFFMQRNNSFN